MATPHFSGSRSHNRVCRPSVPPPRHMPCTPHPGDTQSFTPILHPASLAGPVRSVPYRAALFPFGLPPPPPRRLPVGAPGGAGGGARRGRAAGAEAVPIHRRQPLRSAPLRSAPLRRLSPPLPTPPLPGPRPPVRRRRRRRRQPAGMGRWRGRAAGPRGSCPWRRC